MPVESNFLYHFIVSATVINTHYCVIVNEEVETNTAEYVKAVEACDKEEECGEVRRPVRVV